MKSKSLDMKQTTSEKVKQNRTFDFTSYYKSAAETKTAVENTKGAVENVSKDKKTTRPKNGIASKSERTPNKKKKEDELLEISRIDIEGSTLDTSAAKGSLLNESKLTSTPQISAKDKPKVKSIMKNKSVTDEDYLDSSAYTNKPKKRNKSVSFMLDDTEEVVVKKTKSNESTEKPDNSKKGVKEVIKGKKNKKAKIDAAGKENKRNDNQNEVTAFSKKSRKFEKLKDEVAAHGDTTNDLPLSQGKEERTQSKKRKLKKLKNQNSEEAMEVVNESKGNEEQNENKNRKTRKKKHANKVQQSDHIDAEDEPATKAQKREDKPEAIVSDLESLSIGDNPHTLTNLLDEMTVVDKNQKKKNKQKVKKQKKTTSSTSTESPDLEKIEEGKEKVKWKKKWNRDKKADLDDDVVSTSVVVDNLPLSLVCSYKKQLADQFGKYGPIKKIGVAEMYPADESKPVFTTTIQFQTEEAAIEALAEDSCEVYGQVLHVRRALPARDTTLVVRSFGALSDQSVSSAFAAAGRIRTIRLRVKGKKHIATAFVEFDGPASLQRALELAADARIGGKRVHADRYDDARRRRATHERHAPSVKDSEDDGR